MKVLYICQLNRDKSPGIYNKILSKVTHLSTFLDLDVISLSDKSETVDKIRFYKSDVSFEKTIEDIMSNYALTYDIVLMRYPRISKDFLSVVKRYPNKFFFEHNTLEVNELKFNITSLTFKDFAYLLFKDTNRLFNEFLRPYFDELRYGGKVLSFALGGICVSNSVKRHELMRFENYKTLVQGNGVEVSEIPLIDSPLNYDNIELLFVSGSANKWHGIDRLIEGVKKYEGHRTIIIHVVGRLHHSVVNQLKEIQTPHKYIEYGVVDRHRIAEISSTCNLGVGSLGLHRLGMQEGSTLKVREYMAMGLPFICGYIDIDVPTDYPYALMYSFDDTALDFTLIDDFLEKLKNIKFERRTMRESSVSYINQRDKMKTLAEYLFKLNNGR